MSISRDNVIQASRNSTTDKVSQHYYDRFYPTFLSQLEPSSNILEIGYAKGGSLRFWKSLFPKSKLIYLDKNIEYKDEEHEVIQCDQSDKDQLHSTVNQLKSSSFNLIVDDGSHIPEHEILSFNILFKMLLSENGYYVIEDIEGSYWHDVYHYGLRCRYGIGSKNSALESFKVAVDYVNREFLAPYELKELKRLLQDRGFDLEALNQVSSITFAHNSLFIHKAKAFDQALSNRVYRYTEKENIYELIKYEG